MPDGSRPVDELVLIDHHVHGVVSGDLDRDAIETMLFNPSCLSFCHELSLLLCYLRLSVLGSG